MTIELYLPVLPLLLKVFLKKPLRLRCCFAAGEEGLSEGQAYARAPSLGEPVCASAFFVHYRDGDAAGSRPEEEGLQLRVGSWFSTGTPARRACCSAWQSSRPQGNPRSEGAETAEDTARAAGQHVALIPRPANSTAMRCAPGALVLLLTSLVLEHILMGLILKMTDACIFFLQARMHCLCELVCVQ